MNRYISKSLFRQKAHQLLNELNISIDFDRALYGEDIEGSLAHVAMLAQCGIISKKEEALLQKGLIKIKADIEAGRFVFQRELEDIHMNIEAALAREIGADVAGKLHTARSRNDQVALDLRLYMRKQLDDIDQHCRNLQKTLAEKAVAHSQTIMPGFTHLQIGQAIVFGHHCLAYVEMLARDRSRLCDARKRLNESPLGAAALAGTSFAISREKTAKALGFDRPSANSIDAVSDRDFVIESLAALSLVMIHLSRLGEEITLWASPAFRFITISDDFSTGSSIMPQKRNPDAAELTRAKSGRVIGALVDLLIVMKALPLAYAKDMQQDKEAVFLAFEQTRLCLSAMAVLYERMEVHPEAMRAMAGKGYPLATDIADWLVREKNIPFRQAHDICADLVKYADEKGLEFADIDSVALKQISPFLDGLTKEILSLDYSVASKTSFGGTAPQNVDKAAHLWLERLKS